MTALTTSEEENPMGSYHQSGTFFTLKWPLVNPSPSASQVYPIRQQTSQETIMAPIPSTHLRSITDYIALSNTICLMAEIDTVIEQHGGFPAAFTPAIPQTLNYPEPQSELRMAAEGGDE